MAAMDTIGPYELRGELGRGAMAVVWRGWDAKLGREVAIKEPVIPHGTSPAVADDLAARFVREGKAAAALAHPGIVTIFAADTYDGRPAIVMELIDGQPLSSVLEAGGLSSAAAIGIASQLLEAVGYAHAKGVVHRDIKPDNIFITDEGRVKLTDFGIAHVGTGTALTQAGTVMGTPGYMAPEQVTGQPTDARADLFAIGVVLYECLTGSNPFLTGDAHPTTVMYRVLNEPLPDLRTSLKDVPESLAATIAVATAKDTTQRFASAEDMRRALLGEAVVTMPKAPRVGARKSAGLMVAIVAGVLGIAVIVVLVISVLPGRVAEKTPLAVADSAGGTTAATQEVVAPTAAELLVVGDSMRTARTAVETILDEWGIVGESDAQLYYPDRAAQGAGLLDTGALRRARDEAAKGSASADPLVVEASLALQKEADALLAYHTAIEDEYGGGQVPYQLGLARYYDWYATSLLSGDQAQVDAVRKVHGVATALPQGLDLWFPYVVDQGSPVIVLSGSGPNTGYKFNWDYFEGMTVVGEIQGSPDESLDLFWTTPPEWELQQFHERLSGMQVYSGSGSGTIWWDWADPRNTSATGAPSSYPVAAYQLLFIADGQSLDTMPLLAIAPAGEGALK